MLSFSQQHAWSNAPLSGFQINREYAKDAMLHAMNVQDQIQGIVYNVLRIMLGIINNVLSLVRMEHRAILSLDTVKVNTCKF